MSTVTSLTVLSLLILFPLSSLSLECINSTSYMDRVLVKPRSSECRLKNALCVKTMQISQNTVLNSTMLTCLSIGANTVMTALQKYYPFIGNVSNLSRRKHIEKGEDVLTRMTMMIRFPEDSVG
ncbi:hypothetical protein CRE_27073 [Caenorhabditis remanei]|uniref:Uncharacterized protein n=1 Tax=Caenorhabditis remanei TaxID=31234 RepID=E3LQ31_CAERE|nr:hypothetical protein CRE_27073 [Caenorhabditis remanei]